MSERRLSIVTDQPPPPPRRPPAERPVILCVDDEVQVLEGLTDTLRHRFEVLTTTNGFEAFRILGDAPVEVLLVDMRMPSLDGSTLLTMALEQAPQTTRMVLTGHSQLEDAMRAVNEGAIFRFLIKPCPTEQLIAALDAGVRQHRLLRAERELLSETLRGAVRALSEILALASPEAFGRAARVRYYALALANALEIADVWEIETIALMSQLGAIALPPAVAERLARGAALKPAEMAQVEQMPRVAATLLDGIPRLDSLREALHALTAPNHDVNTGSVPLVARVVRIANDFDLLESQGAEPAGAVAHLRSRGRRYDQDLLNRFAQTLGVRALTEKVVAVTDLQTGMILAEDVSTKQNVLRLARGTNVTPTVQKRLAALGREHIAPCVRVLVPEPVVGPPTPAAPAQPRIERID